MRMLLILQAAPGSELLDRLGELGRGAGQGALNAVVAMAVMLLGWALAALAERILRGSLRALRFDDGVRWLAGPRATARRQPAAVAARTVYWVVMALAALLALEVIGLDLVTSVGGRLGDVLQRIVTSAILLAVGALVALLVGAITRRVLESAELRSARLVGQVTTAILLGFAALLALEQLGFAAQFVMAIGVIAAAAAGLGLALAFGLGCRDLARDFVVEYLRSLDDEGPKRPQ